ncbi:3'(2'),5'-bisphosphate nucleotidase CysQ [Polaromonas eurypsychrophila]|uniref:3'(2'),5'-bisphosphate nucleotidase CysQ n=1 Tax=Polaromonas eurypsychrophila TaxID=1614635 RepID=UPI001667308C|nr:3'(2'),5'-bisphosphate nucleotidase CysQ [Polaromonas eurypsychrophila]
MTFSQKQLQTLCSIAHAAGQEIMAVYGQDGAVWQKDDTSPLTEADLRADAVIRKGLEAAFPGVFVLSEESRSAGDAAADAFFLVDPLDGTKEFLKRNGEFTVNIALVQQGVPIAGVVFAPALGELYYAALGLGGWVQIADSAPQTLQVAAWQPTEPMRVIGSRSHGGDKLAAWLATLSCQHSFVAAGSSLKFCRIAQGQADIYPRFGPTSQWDTAAAHCVLVAAGGAVLDLAGSPLQYGLQRPLLNPEFVAVGDNVVLAVGIMSKTQCEKQT